MKKVVDFGSFVLLLSAAIATGASRFGGGNAQRGETLYRQNCASCHGANLHGRCMAPSLVGVTKHMTDEEIVGHARMIGETMCCARHIRNITDSQFADIVAYFHAVDTDDRVRQRAQQAGGGPSCCSMMSDASVRGSMEGTNGKRVPSSTLPMTRTAGSLTLVFDSIPQPPQVGANGFHVHVQDERKTPVSDARVALAFSMPAMRMDGPTVMAQPEKDGAYAATANLTMAGDWRADVSVTRPGQRAVTAAFDFRAYELRTILPPSDRATRPPRGRSSSAG